MTHNPSLRNRIDSPVSGWTGSGEATGARPVASPSPAIGDMVVVGTDIFRIIREHPLTLDVRSWDGRQAIVARSWLEPEPDYAGFRRSWRSHRCIPTR